MPALDSIGVSLRSALRRLSSRKAFATGVALTLGIGLAAVTFMSAVAYGVLLRPLPYVTPSHLVEVATADASGRPGGVSLPDVDDWRRQASRIETISAFIQFDGSLETPGGTESIRIAAVDRAFFDVLGLPPLRGRLLTADDERASAVVLSAKAWQRFYGGRNDVGGTAIKVNGETATIVGVADRAMALPSRDVDAWIPLEHARLTGPPQWAMRGFRGFRAVGRVRPDSTPRQAADELLTVSKRLAAEYPRFNEGVRTSVVPLTESLTQPVRAALVYLWLGAVLLLVITCANAGSLCLGESVARRQEIAVRLALGAGPLRISLGIMTEIMLLSLAGCGVGFGAAVALVRWFQMDHPERFPRLESIRVDSVIAAIAVVAAIAAALVAAAIPAVRVMRADSADALKETRAAGGGAGRVHRLLVSAQVAMAVLLLLGALSVGRQLSRVLDADLGVTDSNVITARLDLTGAAYASPEAQRRFLRQLLERFTSDGVAAGILSSLPPATGQMRTTLTPVGANAGSTDVLVDIVAATPGAIEALGVPLLHGRPIADSDTTDGTPVALISAAAARRLFPGREALGQRVPFGSRRESQPLVIGVVGDVRYRGLDSAADAAMYVPASQRLFRTMYVVVSARGGRAALGSELNAAVRRIDPSVAVGEVKTMSALRRDASSGYAFRATIIGTLAIAAMFLTAVGIHGVTARSVAVRRREFAVRVALGSRRRQLLLLVVGETAWLCGGGAVCGVALAVLGRQLARGLAGGAVDLDGLSMAGACVAAVLLGVAVALRPTWRAASVDPASALK